MENKVFHSSYVKSKLHIGLTDLIPERKNPTDNQIVKTQIEIHHGFERSIFRKIGNAPKSILT